MGGEHVRSGEPGMIKQLKGLHHVTSLVRDARKNNGFFTGMLGLRRVKKTINFDVPDAYHLYYGTRIGAPGTLITYFPFPNLGGSRMGTGEVGTVAFSVPEGALSFWQTHFEEMKVKGLFLDEHFGEKRLLFRGPEGEGLALVEHPSDKRKPWDGADYASEVAIRGLHSVSLRLEEKEETGEFLKFMGYEFVEKIGNHYRYRMRNGNGADFVEIQELPDADPAKPGAGAVHHVAFAVANREQQLEVRAILLDAGWRVTQVKDRKYFWAIYFRSPGGVLFEVATDEPGFNADEKITQLGQGFMLPEQHEHLREQLEENLEPLED